ncbi:T9SS-dependent M36 family metallopeptidase [Hymenobacter antarcticus]|uniref:T9SS-dependent M36 family metallopeptidase n=1 Tax=Hymenobacter antarcticus TaxID=486270 RepID=A0ABP7QPW8_9BACT
MAQSGTPSTQALTYFATQSQRQGLRESDAANLSVTSSYLDQATGLTHSYLRQRVNGLDVYGAVGDVHTDRTGKPVLMHQGFVADAARLAPSAAPTLTAEQAIAAAAIGLKLPRPVGITLVRDARPGDGLLFNNAGISEYDIPVRLMYLPVNGRLKLVWDVTIAQLDEQHHWAARVDAHTGLLLDKSDYVISEEISFQQLTARALGNRTAVTAATAPNPTAANRGTLATPNSLTVFPVPVEAPTFGNRTAVPFSSISTAYSPYGWQVSDARAPAGTFPTSYSRIGSGVFLTRGNNVAAYDDSPSTASGNGNLLSNTNSPDGTAALDFDFPFSQPAGPKASSSAAITNLFYWNNMLHDVMMSKGFDEASGNFQYRNTGTQGLGGDFVRAESQDGSGRNNANMSTPVDGQSGRMQMYLFDNPVRPTFTISSPAGLAGVYTIGTAGFGRSLTRFPQGLCGTVVAVNDGVSGNGGVHGCATPYVNAAAVSGKIALIMRGGCAQLPVGQQTNSSFAGKIRRAQQNGAIMAIIVDSLATGTAVLNIGGTDTVGIRIPSIFISGVDGARIRQALQAGTPVVGCATAPVGEDFDGSVDNGIIAHEFGHGIHTRLSGGPGNSSCNVASDGTTATQSMGEGWGDFFGLWMTTRPSDVGRAPRGIGTYASGQPTAGRGIRIKQYTDDMAVNNHSYSVIGTTNYRQTHAIGEVWAATLWDLNWQFIYRYGYNTDLLGRTGGNNRFLRLVLEGCKLQVCNPSFLDGRDAILRADSLLNGAANSAVLWTMFARRGMGFSAVGGIRTNGLPTTDGIVAAFNMPPGTLPTPVLDPRVTPLGTQSASAINGSLVDAYPNPTQNVLTIQAQLPSKSAVRVSLVNLIGQVVTTTTAPVGDLQRGLTVNTSNLAEGLYVVRVNTSEGTFTTKVQVKH